MTIKIPTQQLNNFRLFENGYPYDRLINKKSEVLQKTHWK